MQVKRNSPNFSLYIRLISREPKELNFNIIKRMSCVSNYLLCFSILSFLVRCAFLYVSFWYKLLKQDTKNQHELENASFHPTTVLYYSLHSTPLWSFLNSFYWCIYNTRFLVSVRFLIVLLPGVESYILIKQIIN